MNTDPHNNQPEGGLGRMDERDDNRGSDYYSNDSRSLNDTRYEESRDYSSSSNDRDDD